MRRPTGSRGGDKMPEGVLKQTSSLTASLLQYSLRRSTDWRVGDRMPLAEAGAGGGHAVTGRAEVRLRTGMALVPHGLCLLHVMVLLRVLLTSMALSPRPWALACLSPHVVQATSSGSCMQDASYCMPIATRGSAVP